MRRLAAVGLVVASVYVVAVVATVGMSSGHVRPLYDAFGPPSSYRWINPPAFFAPTNVEPVATTESVPLGRDGSDAAGVGSTDGQLALSLAQGAINPSAGARSVTVNVVPRSPRDLPALPDGLHPAGNVYQLDFTYEPGGEPVPRLSKPGTLLMEVPQVSQHLFLSTDGRSWTELPVHVLLPRQLSVSAELPAAGYYVAGTNLPPLAALKARSSRAALLTGLVVGALAAALLAGGAAVAYRRRAGARIHH